MLAIPSLLAISVILYTILALAPGDPLGEIATNPNVPPAVQLALRAKLGLNDPVWQRYLHWLVAMVQGEWGYSFTSQESVSKLIMQRLPVSLALFGSSEVLAVLVAVPVGVLAAVRPYSWLDQIANTVGLIGFSLPTFFTGLVLILVFSVKLNWFPFVFESNVQATGLAWWWIEFKQSIMPIMVIGLFQGASLVRYVRSSMLDVIRLDYVTTARSKGIGARRVLIRHVVRNGLIPVITLVAVQLPIVFGGTIITEQIFRVPGIGSLLISSILADDVPVVMAVTFVYACLVVFLNLLADLLYVWLDPRIALR